VNKKKSGEFKTLTKENNFEVRAGRKHSGKGKKIEKRKKT